MLWNHHGQEEAHEGERTRHTHTKRRITMALKVSKVELWYRRPGAALWSKALNTTNKPVAFISSESEFGFAAGYWYVRMRACVCVFLCVLVRV